MARIQSLNILLDTSGKEYLAELYGKVIEGVRKNLVSERIKNTDLSGNPASGTVEAKRFVNATSKPYGTARTAGKGDAVKARPVTVAIDQDKEIVEELEEKDITLYGVDGVMARRSSNHIQRMVSELDSAFFAEAVSAGASLTLTESTNEGKIEEAIQAAETVKNDFVDGVPRSMISIVLSPAWYGKIRTYLDKVTRANVESDDEEFLAYHGVKAFSSVHLPEGIDFVVMVDGAVAQPVMSHQYTAEKIPLSNAYGVELFYNYGTKAVTPDLIFYLGTPSGATGATGATGNTGG